MKKLWVIVLAWNHWADTRECLDSLTKSEGASFQILLVDNGSTDGTSENVTRYFSDIELIRLEENAGIIRGYNVGMEKALKEGAEFVVVMNNDTAVDPNMLFELQSALEANPKVGVAVPKIVYYDDSKRIWSAGAYWRKFPPGVKFIGLDRPDTPEFNAQKEIKFATNCCLCVRAEALMKAGLFDPGYIFYYVDWDFALRVRRKGYILMYVPQAFLKHKVSLTTQKADPSGSWAKIMGRDSVHFYLSNTGWLSLGGMTFWVIMRDLATGKSNQIVPYLKGVQEGVHEMRRERAV